MVLDRLRKHYQDGSQDELDGLTVSYGDWWFNLRVSNTEPVVRLNVEAKEQAVLEHRLTELTQLIGGDE
jgi:phosphomannomutase